MNRRLLLAVAVLVTAVVLLLLVRTLRRPDGFTVQLTASRLLVGPASRVELTTTLTPADAASGATYSWRTSAGRVRGAGARAQLVAPGEPGQVTVTVTVSARGKTRQAHVQLEVADFREVEAAGNDSSPSPRFPGGYQVRSVTLDKQEICANEDVKVSIAAEDPNGESGWLNAQVTLAGQTAGGMEAVVRPGTEGAQDVSVKIFDVRYPGVMATATAPLRVKPCQAPQAGLVVACGPGAIFNDTIECRAGSGSYAPLPFKPVRFEWSVVNDPASGAPSQTTAGFWRWQVPTVGHAATYNYVFLARAVGPAGEILEGRASAAVSNPYYIDRERLGQLSLRIKADQPVFRGDDVVVHVAIANPFEETISLAQIMPSITPCESSKDGAKPAQPAIQEARAVLGVDHLDPGQEITIDWKMPRDDKRCDARIELDGRGDESGLQARGVWQVPTDMSKVITADRLGAEEVARWEKAREILSQRAGHPVDHVTGQEMDELVQAGLVPARAPGWQPPPPAAAATSPPN